MFLRWLSALVKPREEAVPDASIQEKAISVQEQIIALVSGDTILPMEARNGLIELIQAAYMLYACETGT